MNARRWGSGGKGTTDLAVPTPHDMEKLGAREGRDSYRRLSLFSRGQQDPMPAQNDPHIPGAVRKAEGACRNEAARVAEAYAARAVALEQRIAADEATVESLGQKHLPGPERLLPGWVHIGVLVLLGFAEWMVNALAFAIFGGTNTQTYIVALVVAVLLPVCASVVGSSWKQRRNDGIALLALIASVGLIVAIALIRQAYFYDVVNSILGLNIAPWMLTIIYMVINMAMFFGGVLVSYLHAAHDPEGQEERRALEAAQQRLTADRAAQGGLRARYRAQAEDLGAQLRTLAWAYNDGNMRARRRARRPEHRLQPVWVDAIDGLDVPVPDALLEAPPAKATQASAARPAATGSAPERPAAAGATAAVDLGLGALAHAGHSHSGDNGNGRRGHGSNGQTADRREGSRPRPGTSGTSTSTATMPVRLTTFSSKETAT